MFDPSNDNDDRNVGSRYVGDGMSDVEHLMASGEMLASQLPIQAEWSPCKKLAASVLASALVEIRDHAHDPAYARRIEEDLEWIDCGEEEWPFSFLRICALLSLDAEWVRDVVDEWMRIPPTKRKRPGTPYRQAA